MKPKKSALKPSLEQAQKSPDPLPSTTLPTAELRKDWLIVLFIAVATLAAFAPALHNGFVNWDDYDTVVENPRYRGLSWAHLQWMFTTFHLGHYQPLSWVTFALDYFIWGLDPFGYHLTNLLLHAANAALFYFLSQQLLKQSFAQHSWPSGWSLSVAAGFAALFFSIHTLRVESVAWVTERRDVLSSFFILSTFLCYLQASAPAHFGWQRSRWLATAMILYGLSLLSKATGMTLPVVLLILDFYPLRRLEPDPRGWLKPAARRVWLEKAAFFLLALPFAITALAAQKEAGALLSLERYDFTSRLAQALYGIAFYPRKTLLPFDLSPLYEAPLHFSPWDWPFLLSGVVVAAITLALIVLRRKWPAGLAVWASYIVIVAPVLGFAQSGAQFVADRYSYLSCMGWALLAGAAVFYSWGLWHRGRIGGWSLGITHALGLAALMGLGFLTFKQVEVWHDSERLWHHALKLNPNSRNAHFNLGNSLWKGGKDAEAVEHYRHALEISPSFKLAHFNLAKVLTKRGELEGAIKHLTDALELDPNFADAHINLGNALAKAGHLDKAMEHYRTAVGVDGNSVEALINLGLGLEVRSDLAGAIEQFRRALEIKPDVAEAHYHLGRVLARQGHFREGEARLREAIKLKPDFVAAYRDLGILFAAQGQLDRAIELFREALKIDPESAEAYQSLAQALEQKGERKEALSLYQAAQRLKQSRKP